ncbi:MAG: hypothetical protein AAB368_10705, partial [bacterium]
LAHARTEASLVSLLGLETALADALCAVGAVALRLTMSPEPPSLPHVLGIGAVAGMFAGMLWLLFLTALRSSGHAYPITLGVLLLLHVGVERNGGSGPLAVLGASIVLGNAKAIARALKLDAGLELAEDLKGFHGQFAFLAKAFFFAYLGAQLLPAWPLLGTGAALVVVLFGVRWCAVRLAGAGGGLTPEQTRIATAAFPRGMMAGVLALLPAARGIAGGEVFPPLVAACVAASALAFTVLFPLARRRRPAPSPWGAAADLFPASAAPSAPAAPPDDPPITKFQW